MDKQREDLEAGRRAIYAIAAHECTVLLATLAASCRLERFVVQSNPLRQARHRPSMAQIGGNATYRIGLKTQP